MLPEKLFAAVLVETVVEVHVRPADAYRRMRSSGSFMALAKGFTQISELTVAILQLAITLQYSRMEYLHPCHNRIF